MLYDRWRQIAQHRRTELALLEAQSGRRWRFGELAQEAEQGSADAKRSFPSGVSAEFILTVLKAWRSSAIVCPLETGQPAPVFAKAPKDCVHLKTTSASTGQPRLIAFTAAQLAADADQIVATMGLRPEWPNLGVISLAHSYGFSNLVLPLLLHGIPLVLVGSTLPESFRQASTLFTDITVPAVPALWRAWLDAGAISGRVRLAISAGAPLPLALEKEVYGACGLKIHNFYGASECGGIAYDRSATPRDDWQCAGSPMTGVNVSLNEDGCLCVRSPAVGLTYWPVADESLANGCHQTSDLAELRDGSIYLRGRATDLINVAGRKVSPETVERALMTHPDVVDCVVFGAPSEEGERGEMIVACVCARPGTRADGLRAHVLRQLPAWQLPRDWWFVPELLPNARGKHSRAHWREEYLNRKRGR